MDGYPTQFFCKQNEWDLKDIYIKAWKGGDDLTQALRSSLLGKLQDRDIRLVLRDRQNVTLIFRM